MSYQAISPNTRPYSASKRTDGAMKSQNGDVISYEDLLVAQYLEELKISQPLTKTSY